MMRLKSLEFIHLILTITRHNHSSHKPFRPKSVVETDDFIDEMKSLDLQGHTDK